MNSHALLVLALLVGGAGADDLSIAGTHKAWDPDSAEAAPLRAVGQALEFQEKKPAGAITAPETTIEPRYATIRIAGKTITLVVAKSNERQRHPDRLLVNLNGDDKLHSVDLKKSERLLDDGSTVYLRSCSSVPIRIADRPLPIRFGYRGMDDRPFDAQFVPLWYLETKINIGGISFPLFAQDSDLDGFYGSDADLWFVPADGVRPKAMRPFLLTLFGAGKFISDHRVLVTGAKDDKLTVRVTPAKGPNPKDLVSAREYARAFCFALLEKDEATRGGPQHSRPRTSERIPWRYLTLAEARTAARKEKKPVFINLHSLASVSCFRLSYTTFLDKEVHALISQRFIPVRTVRQEGDGVFGEFVRALGAQRLPAMAVMQPGVEKLQLIAGWKGPAEMARTLRTALGEKVKRDWSPFFGEFPFVVGYEAGMKEAKFTGRPPMFFSVSFNDAAGRKFAQQSFTLKLAGKLLDHYTPILLDVDVDQRVTKKYPVLIASPSIAWIDFDGESIFMYSGTIPPDMWKILVKVPLDRAPDHPVPAEYAALLKLRDTLRTALKANDQNGAQRAIAAIEQVGLGVRVQAEAAAATQKLSALK